jgi:hypothetical protein
MKLDHRISSAVALVAGLAWATGCAGRSMVSPATDDRTATAQLLSAQIVEAGLPSAAPRVGKSHLVDDDDVSDPLGAPKVSRASDGSRRTGNFGTAK